MHLSNQFGTSTRALRYHLTRAFQMLFTALLLAGLGLSGAACDGGGSNGENGNGDDDNGGGITAPAAPSGLSADAGETAVSLTWEAVEEADSYNVYRAQSPTDSASGSPLNTEISSPSYTDEDAANGTTYYYRVTAVASEDGTTAESEGSEEVGSTPFAPPSGLTGTSGDSQIELNWSEAAGAATYNVYRSTTSTDGAEGDPLDSGISETSYTDDSAENGTNYYYRVTSVNPEEEESSASNEVEKTPFDDPPDRP
jgi:fibronectin type 3 domain-containing protein